MAFLACSALGQAQPKAEEPRSDTQAQDEFTGIPGDRAWRAFLNDIVEIIARKKAGDAEADKRKDTREEAAVVATQEAARAAEWAAAIALGALFANIVTIVLVWRTFRATKLTAEGAIRAADAAEAAVAGTSTTARRQLRAYVFVEACFVFRHLSNAKEFVTEAHQYGVGINITNMGQTPAYDCEVHAATAVCDLPLDPTQLIGWSVVGAQRAPLAPNGKLGLALTGDVISAADVEGFVTNRRAIFVFGRIEYRDAFGKKRWTKFRRTWPGLEEGQHPGVNMIVAPEGEEADEEPPQ